MRFPLGKDRKDRNDGNEGKDNTDGHDGEKRQSRRTRRRHAAANVLEVITDPGDGISDDDFVDAEKSDSEEAPATPAPSGEKEASESLPENSPEPASPDPDLSEPTLPHPATDVLLDRFASVDARLNTMNTVLRQQAETISDMNERRLYSRLTGPAEKLAEIHDDLVADLADLADTDDASHAGDLAYLLDGIRGQGQVLGDVSADIARDRPMNRLLQGEVGSGKTVVALLAMLQAHDNGRQSALLAPTEVLAAQHARTITAQLSDAGVDVGVTLLTGSMTANAKRKAMLDIVTGESGIVVGTHALLSEGVEFFDLGLVVIDEQHRFGVRQRDRLRDRAREGFTPHVLVMTATPIPRTLAMTVFGDLDVSALTEIPAERAEITTVVVPGAQKPHWEERAWERIREEVEAGNRAFIVSPRILGEGESVEDNFDLARRKLPGVAVGFVHGQMSSEEKTAAMADFAEGRTDVLVATTVVEVGVNIPEATVMMIRRAESYGVSQLHQLRGRVGRGDRPGLCFLCTDTAPGTPERERLEAIAATNDGFVLADIDVRVRKHGDVLGEDQSGLSGGLGLLDLGNDREIIERARRDAAILAAEDPDLARALTRDITEEEAGYLDRA